MYKNTNLEVVFKAEEQQFLLRLRFILEDESALSSLAMFFEAVGDHVVGILCHIFALKRQI